MYFPNATISSPSEKYFCAIECFAHDMAASPPPMSTPLSAIVCNIRHGISHRQDNNASTAKGCRSPPCWLFLFNNSRYYTGWRTTLSNFISSNFSSRQAMSSRNKSHISHHALMKAGVYRHIKRHDARAILGFAPRHWRLSPWCSERQRLRVIFQDDGRRQKFAAMTDSWCPRAMTAFSTPPEWIRPYQECRFMMTASFHGSRQMGRHSTRNGLMPFRPPCHGKWASAVWRASAERVWSQRSFRRARPTRGTAWRRHHQSHAWCRFQDCTSRINSMTPRIFASAARARSIAPASPCTKSTRSANATASLNIGADISAHRHGHVM